MSLYIRCSQIVLLLLSFSAVNFVQAQEPDLAHMLSQDKTNHLDSSKTNLPLLIVDEKAMAKSYPTMEEEMEMYVQLKSEIPMAYFFPNPSQGIIWIEHNLGQEATVQIRADGGGVIYEAKRSNVNKLDLTGYKQGHYTILLSRGDKIVERLLRVI